jgi:hypothetical protein
VHWMMTVIPVGPCRHREATASRMTFVVAYRCISHWMNPKLGFRRGTQQLTVILACVDNTTFCRPL